MVFWYFGMFLFGIRIVRTCTGKATILYITIFISAVVIYGPTSLVFRAYGDLKGACSDDWDRGRRHLFGGLHAGYIFNADSRLAY